MTINERIRTLRKQKGLNQKEFGAKIGLKQSAASWIEQDGNAVTDQNIRLISETFGVNPAWLRTGEGKAQIDEEEAFIQRMIDSYQMEGLDATVIRAYLTLTREQRQTICEAFQPLIDKCRGVAPDPEREAREEIERKVAAYRAKLEAEKRGSSASTPHIPATTADNRA